MDTRHLMIKNILYFRPHRKFMHPKIIDWFRRKWIHTSVNFKYLIKFTSNDKLTNGHCIDTRVLFKIYSMKVQVRIRTSTWCSAIVVIQITRKLSGVLNRTFFLTEPYHVEQLYTISALENHLLSDHYLKLF